MKRPRAFSGVPVAATKLLAYGLCGVMSALAGVCQAAQEQQGDPEAGGGYELAAIAMVVIGGTSLAGGRGSIALTFRRYTHHRLSRKNTQHQCRRREQPTDVNRRDHRGGGPLTTKEESMNLKIVSLTAAIAALAFDPLRLTPRPSGSSA